MPSSVVGPGHVIAGRYRIERWLGQGGMGSVYRALQLSVQRTVALKRLVDEHLESASHLERFEREALALSRLSHQSTVRLFDFGSDERGCPFIVMEYLEGSDLAADLERHGPMRWDQALAVSLQILGSLAEAHAAGIIHRDIKPANLFLCAGGDWPVVKVLDFGIAGGAEPGSGLRKLTLTGTVLGSAPYMSPEQAQGLPVGAAADLYSLGVVLFEMMTGKTPFEPRTLTAQLIAKVLEVAPSLREVSPEVEAPSEVQALVASLLERDPGKRPPSAQAAAERIQALLARAQLPRLSRAGQRPNPAPAPIAKTEPMLVPHTIDEGWTPPKTEVPRGATLARRAVGWSLLLAVASSAAAGLWRTLPEPVEPGEREAALAVLAAVPAPSREPSEPEVALAALDAGDGSSPAGVDPAAPPGSVPPTQPLGLAPPQPAEVLPPPAATRPKNGATPAARTKSTPASRRRAPAPARQATTPPRPVAPEPSLATASAPTSPDQLPPSAAAPPLEPSTPLTPGTLVLPQAVPPSEGTAPATPAPATPATEAPATEAPATNAPAIDAPAPFGAPSPELPAAAEPAPEMPAHGAPSAEPAPPFRERSPAVLGAPIVDPRYWTIAAARAAARRGDITPAQRNEIILGLRERRLQARARAARAYREGRIDFEGLLRRQRVIDRRIEGW